MALKMMLVIILVYPLAFVSLTGNSRVTLDVLVILESKGSMNPRILTCSIVNGLTYYDKLDTFHTNFLNAEIRRSVEFGKRLGKELFKNLKKSNSDSSVSFVLKINGPSLFSTFRWLFCKCKLLFFPIFI